VNVFWTNDFNADPYGDEEEKRLQEEVRILREKYLDTLDKEGLEEIFEPWRKES